MLTCFGMIEIMTNFQDKTQNLKICALSKIHISPNFIIKKHMTYWGNYKYNI